MCSRKSLTVFVTAPVFCFLPLLSSASEIETALYDLNPSTFYPTPETLIQLQITQTSGCFDVQTNSVLTDQNNGIVQVSFDIFPADFTGCPFPVQLQIPVGVLSQERKYQIYVYQENAQGDRYFDDQFLQGIIDIEVTSINSNARPETPAEGSVQSGIGLVRGWVCNAQSVEIQFDDLPRMQVAYGSTRPDTEIICGDVNNGYGLVTAFGLLGKGIHRMKTFIDDKQVSDVQFEVTGLDDPFARGLSASYNLTDFPHPGESVQIRWSEPDQNFIIVDTVQ